MRAPSKVRPKTEAQNPNSEFGYAKQGLARKSGQSMSEREARGRRRVGQVSVASHILTSATFLAVASGRSRSPSGSTHGPWVDPAGDRIRAFNFGVSGYSAEEIDENLRVKGAIQDVNEVVYLMHMNDFAHSHSSYEGASG